VSLHPVEKKEDMKVHSQQHPFILPSLYRKASNRDKGVGDRNRGETAESYIKDKGVRERREEEQRSETVKDAKGQE